MLACVGSWNGSFGRGGWSPPFPPPAGETAKTVNNARRAAVLHWNGPFGPTRWRRADGVDLGAFARPAWTGARGLMVSYALRWAWWPLSWLAGPGGLGPRCLRL